LHNGDNKEELK